MHKFLLWIPRVIIILYIAFLTLFSLDSTTFSGFLIHNIPVFVLILITFISWRKRLLGGLFLILFTIFLGINLKFSYPNFVLILPPLISGLIFIFTSKKHF